MAEDYEVGYRKPPKRGQFKKGQSGNANGRPKGTKNLKTDLLEEFSETIVVREGDRKNEISKQRTLIKSLMARALNGDDRPAAKILDLYLRLYDRDEQAAQAGAPLSADEQAIMQNVEARIRRQAGAPAKRTKKDQKI